MASPEKRMRANEVAEALGWSARVCSGPLSTLVRDGKLGRDNTGAFFLARKVALCALAPVELSEADARQLATLETDAATLIAQLPSERQGRAREAIEAAVKGRDLPRRKGLVRKLHDALDASAPASDRSHTAA